MYVLMSRQKEIRGGITVKTFTLDAQRMDEFHELCQKTRKTMSEYIRELVEQELEKKVIGQLNPLNIKYHDNNKSFDEFPTDRAFKVEEAHTKIREEYLEKNVPLHYAYAYHNNMQQVIALKMRQLSKMINK